MLPLPAISSAECVQVLCRFGFGSVEVSEHERVLERGAARVVVPSAPVLDSDTVFEILRNARIPLDRFLEELGLLDRAVLRREQRPATLAPSARTG